MTRRFLNYILTAAVLAAAQISVRADATNLITASLFENDIAYLRVGDVGKNLADEIQSAENALAATNKIDGTVLDLRLADGSDAASAKSVADRLAQTKLPLAILTDDETRGAAVDLAKDLRDGGVGLIFGGSTNLSPDISVSVSAADEKKFLKNPWGMISTNQTPSASATTNGFFPFPIDHTTEADLVRARVKDGEEDDTIAKPEPQKPFIRDPILARGLDFIKGLAALRPIKN